MKLKRFHTIAMILAMLPILGACRQELCYDHYPTIDINFDWEQEWERDYGRNHLANWDTDYFGCEYDDLRPGVPEWVNMVSYYDDGRQVDAFMSPDGKHFIVEAGEGRSVLLYNGDTEYIVLSDVASLNEARATATTRSRSRASLATMFETYQKVRTTNPPDILYASYVDRVPTLANHDRHQMQVKMQPLVYTYHVTFEFEYGLQHVALARGALGGMAESVYLRTGVTSDDTAIILFDCTRGNNCCQAQVRSFGIPGFPDTYYGRSESKAPGRPYTLSLEVMLQNGNLLEFTFDITDQMKDQPRGGVIKVGGIRIEDSQNVPNSGFAVDVSGWDDTGEDVDLPIGSQPGAQ